MKKRKITCPLIFLATLGSLVAGATTLVSCTDNVVKTSDNIETNNKNNHSNQAVDSTDQNKKIPPIIENEKIPPSVETKPEGENNKKDADESFYGKIDKKSVRITDFKLNSDQFFKDNQEYSNQYEWSNDKWQKYTKSITFTYAEIKTNSNLPHYQNNQKTITVDDKNNDFVEFFKNFQIRKNPNTSGTKKDNFALELNGKKINVFETTKFSDDEVMNHILLNHVSKKTNINKSPSYFERFYDNNSQENKFKSSEKADELVDFDLKYKADDKSYFERFLTKNNDRNDFDFKLDYSTSSLDNNKGTLEAKISLSYGSLGEEYNQHFSSQTKTMIFDNLLKTQDMLLSKEDKSDFTLSIMNDKLKSSLKNKIQNNLKKIYSKNNFDQILNNSFGNKKSIDLENFLPTNYILDRDSDGSLNIFNYDNNHDKKGDSSRDILKHLKVFNKSAGTNNSNHNFFFDNLNVSTGVYGQKIGFDSLTLVKDKSKGTLSKTDASGMYLYTGYFSVGIQLSGDQTMQTIDGYSYSITIDFSK